jgi:N-acylneuraminate cytidylyltransferase
MRLAIIPARGGSKRIPRKNIKLFHGKPMIAYSIAAAQQSGCFDQIILSTDDAEIAAVGRDYGAEVPFTRPAQLANDHATTMDVIQHALRWADAQGLAIEQACCIYATAPFLTPESLQRGLEALNSGDLDYAFSATTFAFPIQRAIGINKQGEVRMFAPEHANTRSQDLEEAYHDAGQFYWGRAEAFREGRAIFSNHSKAIVLPRRRVQDIDTPEDWLFAEALFNELRE